VLKATARCNDWRIRRRHQVCYWGCGRRSKTLASQSPRQWHPSQDPGLAVRLRRRVPAEVQWHTIQIPDSQSCLTEKFPRRAVDCGEIRVAVFSVGGVPTGTRPFPVDGPSRETAADRVEVDVIDRGQDRLFGREIAIIARPFLPEACGGRGAGWGTWGAENEERIWPQSGPSVRAVGVNPRTRSFRPRIPKAKNPRRPSRALPINFPLPGIHIPGFNTSSRLGLGPVPKKPKAVDNI
jgi:hypothetical protein